MYFKYNLSCIYILYFVTVKQFNKIRCKQDKLRYFYTEKARSIEIKQLVLSLSFTIAMESFNVGS